MLEELGFSFERARAKILKTWDTVDGISMKQLSSNSLETSKEKFGAWSYSVHRVDLHKELLRLALYDEDGGNKGRSPIELHLGAPIAKVDVDAGFVELEDGSKHGGDLLVAADGLHSVVRKAALGQDPEIRPSGMSAFRFLVPTEKMKNDPDLERLLQQKVEGICALIDSSENARGRHAVWYDCQG